MAKKFIPEMGTKGSVGHPQGIEDEPLVESRNFLVWLLESTWGDIGCRLPYIKSAADVRVTFEAWQSHRQNNYLNNPFVDAILRPSESPAMPNKLNAIRRQLGELNQSIRKAYEFQEQRRQSLERAERALADEYPDSEKRLIQLRRNDRAAAFASAEAEYRRLCKQHKELEDNLRDGEAYFARAEVVRFCRSKRYRLTPLNTANALAGLPSIGWRQSMKRCSKWTCPGAGGLAYQKFELFRQIVASCRRRKDLIKHTEQWLRGRRRSESHAVAELRKDWYYLRTTLETVQQAKLLSRELPCAILRDYLQRSSRRSAADLFFEEEEQILL